jgi:hypothetical protein
MSFNVKNLSITGICRTLIEFFPWQKLEKALYGLVRCYIIVIPVKAGIYQGIVTMDPG